MRHIHVSHQQIKMAEPLGLREGDRTVVCHLRHVAVSPQRALDKIAYRWFIIDNEYFHYWPPRLHDLIAEILFPDVREHDELPSSDRLRQSRRATAEVWARMCGSLPQPCH